jgi:thiamine-phosphate pyrophosphorylase
MDLWKATRSVQTYAIANCDSAPGAEYFRRVGALVEAGVDWIQLRAKTLEDQQVYTIGLRLRELTRSSNTRFLVNGRADIAASVSADGVHLPASGLPAGAARMIGPDFLIGRSCHSAQACRAAAEEGADYVLLGPVFTPRSKPGKGIVSREELAEAQNIGIPVFALGGISCENVESLRGLKIAGIAAVTLFMSDGPPGEIVRMVRAL